MKEAHINSSESKSIDIVKSVSCILTGERRKRLLDLEAEMLQHEQVDIPPTHRFSGGIYSREITIPKDTLLTGRIHKFDHFDIMLSGDITVSTDSGDVKRLTGLHILEGKAGKKRAGYAHEDTHWITFHSAEERDPEDMYEFLTCGSFDELAGFNALLANTDYAFMIEEMGMTEEEIQGQVQNEKDMIDIPDQFSIMRLADSPIHGIGLFSVVELTEGHVIAPARVGDMRTIAGRYTNHSILPNAEMRITSEGVDLVAIKDINFGEEITVNYRNVLADRACKGDLCQQ